MQWADDFPAMLAQLSDLDQTIIRELLSTEINSEEIADLVDKREQLLNSLMQLINQSPQLANTEHWQIAVKQTQEVVNLMQDKTKVVGQSLHKYRHGNKSVQQYKKFL